MLFGKPWHGMFSHEDWLLLNSPWLYSNGAQMKKKRILGWYHS
uniref:Uncharacterized protein n=1 Tax=Anguilla anguilla TaxID=7936 RepID=A0A0E9WAQ3_ANGAN